MSEKTPTSEDLMKMIESLGKQSAPAASGWKKQPAALEEIQAVLIPISMEIDGGKMRAYLKFPGSVASSPESLYAFADGLLERGMPLDIWKRKGDWNRKKGWS